MKPCYLLIPFAAFALPCAMQAQHSSEARTAADDTKIIYVDNSDSIENDSVKSLINRFYLNQYRHFQDPEAPKFMFMTKDKNWAMGVGATIKLLGWADWNGSLNSSDFSPYLIEIPIDDTQRCSLNGSPTGTSITFTVLGRNTPLGDFLGYVEANFGGAGKFGMRLKKAYVVLGDWTVGYATSTFIDAAAETPVVDGAGPTGQPSRTNMLVRYQHNFKKTGWSLGAGVEFPNSSIADDGGPTKPCSDIVPDVAAHAQYSWDGGKSHVRVAGLMRVMRYRDLISYVTHAVPGWGVQASAVCSSAYPVTFYGQFIYGKGHASYINDLSIDNFDLIEDPTDSRKMYAPRSMCANLGVRYNILHNLFTDVAVGHARNLPNGYPGDDVYKWGNYLSVNCFWNITSRIRVGAEYAIGSRKNFNGDRATVNRVAALFQISI